jgi:hypothetical protein
MPVHVHAHPRKKSRGVRAHLRAPPRLAKWSVDAHPPMDPFWTEVFATEAENTEFPPAAVMEVANGKARAHEDVVIRKDGRSWIEMEAR